MANTDEAEEIPKTDLERFQDLEVAAWKWQEGGGKKRGEPGNIALFFLRRLN